MESNNFYNCIQFISHKLLEIALISKSNEKNRLVLAKLFGNTDLKCNGDDESATVLKYGLEIDELYHVKSKMMKLTSQNTWHSGYHSFKLFWSPENIVFKIDEESYHLDTNNLPLDFIFDSEVNTYLQVLIIFIFHYNYTYPFEILFVYIIVFYVYWGVSWWHE